jgi:SAM-dependent methyltransferase
MGTRDDKPVVQRPRWERLADQVAVNYERYLVPTIFRPWAEDLLALAAPRPGDRVLDVACGSGVVARLAAEVVGPGRVSGLDVSPAMLAVARRLPPELGIGWQPGTAAQMPFPDGAFDLVLCQQGVQFLPDAATGLREMRRVLRPEGRLVVAVWASIQRSPGFAALAEALEQHLGAAAAAAARSPFTLADADDLRALLYAVGLRDIEIVYRERTLCFPDPAEFVRRYVFSSPVAATLEDADPSALDPLVPDLTTALAPHLAVDGLGFPIGNHLAVATR